ncbi:polymer-forming cytoskeletal protein [Cohnella pontilimi]|nr:polymer-forming cytoskeletal protein [Cohnella pontilimi]
MDHKVPDLHISGVSTAPGGHYRQVTIEGVGKVEGNVQADDGCKISGIVTVRGDLQAASLRCEGKLKVEGRLSAESSQIDGYADVRGPVHGETLVLKGGMNVKGDCSLERFDAEGGFEIDGLLNAGQLDIRLYGKGKAREIGGESIRVRKGVQGAWKKLWQRMFPVWNPELTADLIEGDEADLEHSHVSIVRGNRVILGPGCRIGLVEYRSELIKHPAAKVGKERKTGDGSHFA